MKVCRRIAAALALALLCACASTPRPFACETLTCDARTQYCERVFPGAPARDEDAPQVFAQCKAMPPPRCDTDSGPYACRGDATLGLTVDVLTP